MQLSPSISLMPFTHGKYSFAGHLRSLCLNNHYDCIAIDLPEPLEEPLCEAVDRLPCISAVVATGYRDPLFYAPADPCDAVIEAIRQAKQNRIHCAFIGYPCLRAHPPLPPLPDEHAVCSIGFDAYAALCLHAIGNPDPDEDPFLDCAAQYCAYRLHDLSRTCSSILALIHFRHFTRAVHHFGRERTCNLSFDKMPVHAFQTFTVNPDHLYFALGELPFVAGKHEKTRQDPFAVEPDSVALVKDLFRETRDEYYDHKDDTLALSPARIQVALTFLRNLTIDAGYLMPSLFDIVTAARGVGGNGYALRILASARYYPYLPVESGEPFLSVGIDRVTIPGESHPHEAHNLFRDTALTWKKIDLKPDPSFEKKKQFRFRWNPLGMCSHVPEDRRIESFNAHLRKKARRVLCENLARSEKFTVSIKDGIDIRETLRNWYTGDIFVRELPPSRGTIDTVVIIFDDNHDERYPHQGTWYAEHEEESTLTFYATEPFADLIGPGIARSTYGGLSLLFPPRPIPNIFDFKHALRFDNLAQRIIYGALLFSEEKIVACISARKPGAAICSMARKAGKHLVWLPLNSFSNETLRRLRRFHVLNGKTVRSWASRFIGD